MELAEAMTDRFSHRTELDVTVVNGRVRCSVYWDDLDPEPRREQNMRSLHEVRRELRADGYNVSDVNTEYGRAWITITEG
jgi:hypothetical protein